MTHTQRIKQLEDVLTLIAQERDETCRELKPPTLTPTKAAMMAQSVLNRVVLAGDIAPHAELPWDDGVKKILSWLALDLRPVAFRMRELGLYDIPRKIEFEQAAALHWMLNLYLKYGERWLEEGEKILGAGAAEKTAA